MKHKWDDELIDDEPLPEQPVEDESDPEWDYDEVAEKMKAKLQTQLDNFLRTYLDS
jgi:hypothetical protein